MAKIIAPFKIVGTLDDMNYYITTDGNIARTKGKTGITSKQFKENPIFEKMRLHNQEFGSCVQKAKTFRLLVKPFFDAAKEGSFAGRVNKMLFEILKEDSNNELGKRTLEAGLKTKEGVELLEEFEANKTRPLILTLKRKLEYNSKNHTLNIKNINPQKDFNWPSEWSAAVQIQFAQSQWDYEKNTFQTTYSEPQFFIKENKKYPLICNLPNPEKGKLELLFISINFYTKDRKKYILNSKKENTTTIIATNH